MKRKAKKIGVTKRKGKVLGRSEMKKVSGGYLQGKLDVYDPSRPDGDDSIIGRLNARKRTA